MDISDSAGDVTKLYGGPGNNIFRHLNSSGAEFGENGGFVLPEDTFIYGGEGNDKVEIFNGIARASLKDMFIDLGDGNDKTSGGSYFKRVVLNAGLGNDIIYGFSGHKFVEGEE